eukprot:CAMPEP_0201544324 /NCGR_PEP_ID=MMETSP0173_2-20130828/918_1 /ASSEMBLY_ACC=CAM_ASM_000268 /TAXON_ID=218659 /ORGANISM="Vexillifera sp., Strain DIVA3 564/2" /LENGTH=717 /DNA_ID=CAMNT_0047952393 /DNA_START=667 /DNA_END=2820 /DNA_ORIENTATION=+
MESGNSFAMMTNGGDFAQRLKEANVLEDFKYEELNDAYDFILELDSFQPLLEHGYWNVTVHSQSQAKKFLLDGYRGINVGVIGLYNKGKTWFFNRLSGASLVSDSSDSTRGLSFKLKHERGETEATQIVMIDTAGRHPPSRLGEAEETEKSAVEAIHYQLLLELCDVFIVVVNDLTYPDQLLLVELIEDQARQFKQKVTNILLVHNWKSGLVKDIGAMFKRQVEPFFPGACSRGELPTPGDPHPQFFIWNSQPQVETEGYVTHVVVVNESPNLKKEELAASKLWNDQTFKHISQWIRHKVPAAASSSVRYPLSDSVGKLSNLLDSYLEGDERLCNPLLSLCAERHTDGSMSFSYRAAINNDNCLSEKIQAGAFPSHDQLTGAKDSISIASSGVRATKMPRSEVFPRPTQQKVFEPRSSVYFVKNEVLIVSVEIGSSENYVLGCIGESGEHPTLPLNCHYLCGAEDAGQEKYCFFPKNNKRPTKEDVLTMAFWDKNGAQRIDISGVKKSFWLKPAWDGENDITSGPFLARRWLQTGKIPLFGLQLQNMQVVSRGNGTVFFWIPYQRCRKFCSPKDSPWDEYNLEDCSKSLINCEQNLADGSSSCQQELEEISDDLKHCKDHYSKEQISCNQKISTLSQSNEMLNKRQNELKRELSDAQQKIAQCEGNCDNTNKNLDRIRDELTQCKQMLSTDIQSEQPDEASMSILEWLQATVCGCKP